jgi:5'-3' exonuclease
LEVIRDILSPFIEKKSYVFVFQILRSENVEFVVAPYEADAQLAYLTTLDADQGGIAAVVTEDSDLIAYCCPAVRQSLSLHMVFILI